MYNEEVTELDSGGLAKGFVISMYQYLEKDSLRTQPDYKEYVQRKLEIEMGEKLYSLLQDNCTYQMQVHKQDNGTNLVYRVYVKKLETV